ncbi:acyltransferase [Labedella populi]|uniref:Acyltransferase n=1 Tax=Labedella populi TaxID=2498850 RepID=A0A444QD24_9MICO|nr:acyltransferase family protein [Labedella populi]RWZ64563.1 acyltransferase [Labedella populi]
MTTVEDRLNTRAPAERAPRRPFRADIQGLRAIAVGLVVLDHAGVPLLGGGYVGVDVFFVISGFLITGHLLEGLHRTGRIDLARFYAARARRILPAALVTIVLTTIASFLVVSPLRVVDIVHDALASALYVPNIVFAVRETDYLAGTAPSPFQHFWSLGVEEQFYIVWPVLLLVAYLVGRRSRSVLLAAIAVVTVASFAASVLTTPVSEFLAFFSPHTRAWEFGVGALLAGCGAALARVPGVVAGVLGWAGLLTILLAGAFYSADIAYPGVAALVPVGGAALVVAFGARGEVGRALSARPLQVVGAISYSLYLVHWPMLVLTHEHLGIDSPLALPVGLVIAAAAVPVAWVLYTVVETPIRSWRGPSRRVLVASTAATLVVVTGLVAGSAAASVLPLTSSRTEPERSAGELPTGTPFVPANLSPTLDRAIADTGEIYTNGCQQNLRESTVLTCSFGALDSPRTMALFGDSHAGRWFPALERAATALGYRLDTYTKSGCRSEETAAAWESSKNDSCSAWREAAVARITADAPDVVVLANHLGPTPGKDPSVQSADWVDGLSQLYDRLPASSRVITLADSPEFAASPVLCLSSHLDAADVCAVERSDALNPAIREAQRTVAADRGGAVVDLTDYLCNTSTCPAVIGSTLVYSDEHHLTATFSQTLAGALSARLAPHLEDVG